MNETVICGASHPDLGERTNKHGEALTPMTCTGAGTYVAGKVVPHRGKHRARLLHGVVLRWTIEVAR